MLVNAYVSYKTFIVNKGKTLLSHNEFRKMVVLAKVSPTEYGADKQKESIAVQRGDHRFRTRKPSTSKRSISSVSSTASTADDISLHPRKNVKEGR